VPWRQPGMWKTLVLMVLVACGDGSDPAHHENNCGGACPPDACGGGATCGDGTCNAGETTQTCAVDCPAPICNVNGTCDGAETPQNCAADCPPPAACNTDGVCDANEMYATCMTDCGSRLRMTNNSSYTIFYLYVKTCASSAWGQEQLGANVVSPGVSFTISNIPPGCYNFKANDSGLAHTWQSPAVNLTPGAQYTWTIIN
jgi:hypothetical protein